jgi:hypothetical protein
MKCQLCKRNKAFLIARIGEATLKVCVYCSITEKLDVVEVYREQEQKRMEEGSEEGTELHLSNLRKKGD